MCRCRLAAASRADRSHLTSGYAEHHSRHFAEEGSEANDSGDPHAVKVAFDFWDSRTCGDWLEEEVSRSAGEDATEEGLNGGQPHLNEHHQTSEEDEGAVEGQQFQQRHHEAAALAAALHSWRRRLQEDNTSLRRGANAKARGGTSPGATVSCESGCHVTVM